MHPESNLDSKIIDTITPRAGPESEQRVKRGAPGSPWRPSQCPERVFEVGDHRDSL